MSFVSFEFLLFFVAFVAIYFMLPQRWRLLFLLISSYILYAYWNAYYVILILVSTLVDYVIGLRLGQTENRHSRRSLLLASMALNLGILFTFKYLNFFGTSINQFFVLASEPAPFRPLDLVLPVGISFYTFQSMSYTIDVYRRDLEPERNFVRFATYIAFFPQLVAGPIERAGNMLPQFKRYIPFEYDRTVRGLRLILWGVFKKVVIADRLAVYVNAVYGSPQSYEGLPLILATLFFAFQIYCDFSGYTDIAIGTAEIMGFNLMKNFRQPYFSSSVSEFWRRWHISLSTWFRDYLYIPLGGNRVQLPRQLVNLMIVFVVSGLWHGASWTFVIWGALHGALVAAELLLTRVSERYAAMLATSSFKFSRMALTFLAVCFAWIFFRSATMADALYVVTHLFTFDSQAAIAPLQQVPGLLTSPQAYLVLIGGLLALLLLADLIDARVGLIDVIGRAPVLVRWGIYYVAVAAVFIALNSFTIVQDFIYFQF